MHHILRVALATRFRFPDTFACVGRLFVSKQCEREYSPVTKIKILGYLRLRPVPLRALRPSPSRFGRRLRLRASGRLVALFRFRLRPSRFGLRLRPSKLLGGIPFAASAITRHTPRGSAQAGTAVRACRKPKSSPAPMHRACRAAWPAATAHRYHRYRHWYRCRYRYRTGSPPLPWRACPRTCP